MRSLLSFLLIAMMGCEGGGGVFHCIIHRPAIQSDAIKISLTNRNVLQKCGGELLGILDSISINDAPHIVAAKGGSYYVIVNHSIEVWQLTNSECLK